MLSEETPLIPLLKKKFLPGLTGIGFTPEGVCVVRVERATGRPPAITLVDFQPWEQNEPQERLLGHLAARYQLKRARCTTLLDSPEYSLLLTEAPDVPPAELRAAMRWRIKDLIDFHINDATLDAFDIPGAPTGAVRMMYAVAARSAAIQKHVDLMDATDINLEIIDIPEMAQRNVAALLPEDIRGVVCLSFAKTSGLLTITKQAELYLSRNLDIGFERLVGGGDLTEYFDRIVLEVQRSLDYFESHFRQPPVAGVALAPLPKPIPGLVDYLKANLNLPVSVMDLCQLANCPGELASPVQSRCFITLGAALRQEAVAL